MRKIVVLALALACSPLLAQDKDAAEKMVDEGIAYHDKGDYEGAIVRYDKALTLDKDNLMALGEKALSLQASGKYEEAITYCERAIAAHPDKNGLNTVYVTYGNAYDGLNKTDKSIEIYDKALKQFPDYYQLYYNKGITLASVKKYDEAIGCFQKAVLCNRRHASSHNAIARLLSSQDKRIPSLLAYSRFMVLEQRSPRAKENLAGIQKIMKGNVEQTGKKSVTVNISPDMLDDKDAPKENNFRSADLLLAMDASLDYDKKNSKKTEVEQFIRKFDRLCESLKETAKNNSGFYWEYYVPYFVDMHNKKLVETFAYIVFSSTDTEDVAEWRKAHKDDIDQFYKWSSGFEWKTL